MKPIENQRMLDLLRVCRSELFVEHQLIDEKEYTWLATLPSKETHARLADYDKLRARIAELEAAAEAVVAAWDEDEIGQVDGGLIDGLRPR